MKGPRVFVLLLAALLAGLMFFDKTFAYLGVGPLFVTEIVLFIGLAAVIPSWRVRGLANWKRVSRWQAGVLLAFLLYEGLRTAVDVPHHGMLALRDGVTWGYAVFTVAVVAAAGREDPERWISWYRRIVPFFVLWVPVAVLLNTLRPWDPMVPGRGISLYLFKPGDLLVHLAGVGAALALWPGEAPFWRSRRAGRWLLAALWGLGFVLGAGLNRGGMLACLAGLLVVVILGSGRRLVPLAAGTVVVSLVFGFTGIRIHRPAWEQGSVEKEISVRHTVERLADVMTAVRSLAAGHGHEAGPAARRPAHGSTGGNRGSRKVPSPTVPAPAPVSAPSRPVGAASSRLGTVRWRLSWWRTIVGYTFGGPLGLWGKGYGINLADSDGFQPQKNHGLRDPHNVFMTFLARSGIPGLLLFVTLMGTVLAGLLVVRRHGEGEGRRMAIWLMAYLTAMLVNASFDVYIENPMGGVWFWALVGVAMVLGSRPPEGQP